MVELICPLLKKTKSSRILFSAWMCIDIRHEQKTWERRFSPTVLHQFSAIRIQFKLQTAANCYQNIHFTETATKFTERPLLGDLPTLSQSPHSLRSNQLCCLSTVTRQWNLWNECWSRQFLLEWLGGRPVYIKEQSGKENQRNDERKYPSRE